MEKYYFKEAKKTTCDVYNTSFLSSQCTKCNFCHGFDLEEKWVKCAIYSTIPLVKNLEDENEQLKKRVDHLEKQISKGIA